MRRGVEITPQRVASRRRQRKVFPYQDLEPQAKVKLRCIFATFRFDIPAARVTLSPVQESTFGRWPGDAIGKRHHRCNGGQAIKQASRRPFGAPLYAEHYRIRPQAERRDPDRTSRDGQGD